MKITFGNVLFTNELFAMFLGDKEKILSISIMLDPKCRHFDSTLIADALRQMADKLEAAA